MSKEEEPPARLTRGALRRMSVEQEPTSAPGTPKKTVTAAATSKKVALLDAIQEGSNGPSDAEVEGDGETRAAAAANKSHKDTSLLGANRSTLKSKDSEKKTRSRVFSLTEDNVSIIDSGTEARRTPRRRASQDQTLTPQTLPKRVTRRNSVTSDDGALASATPKTSRTRHSIAAPAIIVEDDEKEEQANVSASQADADLSDLDIRKLRNRSISNSPVPRASPSNKSSSTINAKDDESEKSPTKGSSSTSSSPMKLELTAASNEEAKSVTESPTVKDSTSAEAAAASPQRVAKDVKFDEATPEQLNRSKYPKTPVAASGEKRRKLSEKADESANKVPTVSDVIVIDETIKDSPPMSDSKTETTKTPKKTNQTPKKEQPVEEQSHEEEASPDKSLDASLVNIANKVSEDMNQSDLSMSILGTPKPTGAKQKSHFSHLREGSSSTPIAAGKQAALDDIPEEDQTKEEATSASKSWSQAVKGSSSSKGIDLFSVRKQEEEEKKEEQAKALNESLKSKSAEKKRKSKTMIESDGEDEEEEMDASQKQNSFVDDEAMEVQDYESGDSLDSETRAEMEDNDIDQQGESIGSQDTEEDEEEDEDDDSFIASDGEDVGELLEGTGDELHSEEEDHKTNAKQTKKKKTRIIQLEESSEDEQQEASKTEKTIITLNDTTLSESKSPKKHLDTSKISSPKKSPAKKPVETKSPRKSSITKDLSDGEAEQDKSTEIFEDSKPEAVEEVKESPKVSETSSVDTTQEEVTESPKSPKKTPTDVSSPVKSPSKSADADVSSPLKASETPKSPKKTPAKSTPEVASKEAKSAEKRTSKTMESVVDVTEAPKSRKSLPTPALISADFYSSAAKKAKRHTINVMAEGSSANNPIEDEEEETVAQKSMLEASSSNMVTNPAALALAKKNKRLSLGVSTTDPSTTKKDKRASLPSKLPVEKDVDSPLKKKSSKKQEQEEEEEEAKHDEVEPMEVDEEEEEEETESPSPKKPVVVKKKPKDLSEFDTEAILSRCNEVVRADKQKRKEAALLRQKKKDEKRRQRELEQQAETGEGEADESMEQQKKKKKKKKKVVNYLLEELGETKEDQVARALQRKMALLEAKRERKKAKKAAKLRQQLNKENEDAQGEKQTEGGIAAKLEKKAKKAKKVEKEATKSSVVMEEVKPIVKRAISAFAMYSEQIEELKQAQSVPKSKKLKQKLKEKNQQPTAMEEVQATLQAKTDAKKEKKDKTIKQKSEKVEEKISSEVAESVQEHSKVDKKKGTVEKVMEVPVKAVIPEKQKKKSKPVPAVESDESPSPKKTKHEQINTAPLKSVVSLDDELAQLKKSLMDPVSKIVKKQKLSSSKETSTATSVVREVTPPRKTNTGKLKALSRLESGFHEEPVTPDHKLLKRNHGFKEEPVTPKTVGFKVSSVLPAGQETLMQQALEAKKKKKSNRNGPKYVKEPAKGLPLPIWTRSGTFEVEEVEENKSKKAYKSSDYVPLNVDAEGTEFLVKPLGGKSKKETNGGVSKVHMIDRDTVDESVINFKKQAIFGKNAHLREKKPKH